MKILYFAPFSYIRDFAFPIASTINALLEDDHQVSRLVCDRSFKTYCTSMKSINLSPNASNEAKEKICKECISNASSMSKIKGLKTYYTSSFISDKEKEIINQYIDSLSLKSFNLDSYFGSSNLNRIAFYEVILRFKINNVLKMDNEQFEYFKNELKNCYISLKISENFKKIHKNQTLIILSPQYGVLNSFYTGYKTESLKTYCIEGSNNNYYKNNILRCYDWDINKLVNPAKKKWKFFKDEKFYLDKKGMKIVKKHISAMLNARSQHVYSKRKSLLRISKKFDLSKFKKTALLNMSSNDEAFAAHVIGAFPDSKMFSKIFRTQIEWITHTINYFKNLPDYCLIIRVHPREFANKRENVISQHWHELKSILGDKSIPGNIIINWPQDNISFYDLINDVDVLIANNSITVVEALYHDVPVVTYDNTITNYPDEMVYFGTSIKDYEINILLAFTEKRENLKRLALNWFVYTQYTSNLILKNKISSTKLFKAFRRVILILNSSTLTSLLNKIELKLSNLEEESKLIFQDVIRNNHESVLDSKIISKKNK
jgi:hypothetical protein